MPAPFLLAPASIWVTVRKGVAVGGELVCSDLKLVVVDRAYTTLLDVAGEYER